MTFFKKGSLINTPRAHVDKTTVYKVLGIVKNPVFEDCQYKVLYPNGKIDLFWTIACELVTEKPTKFQLAIWGFE